VESALAQVGRFADVGVEIDAELDRRTLTVRDILRLDVGSVIKMSRSAGENLDVLIGGVLVCFGEIVVTETTTGVRITDFKHEE
jgi:flagellar motor switch protein FliN/FliY